MENNYENIKIEIDQSWQMWSEIRNIVYNSGYVLDDTEIAEMLSGSRLTKKDTGKSTKPTKHY